MVRTFGRSAIGAVVLAAVALSPGCSKRSPAGAGPAASADAGVEDPTSRTLRETSLADSGAYAIVQSLTDEVGPRLSGSPGMQAAIAWGVRTMQAAGLARVHAEPVTVPHWERGVETAAMTAPRAQPLAVTALGGSVATPPDGIDAEVVRVESIEAAEKLAPDGAKGKIVFFDVPIERARDGSGYGHGVKVRVRAAALAAKAGAVAAVVRSIGTDETRLPHTGAMRYDDGAPKIPAAALSIPDADLLARATLRGPVRMRLTLGCRTLPDAQAANVVGDVVGSAAPDEIVLVGAHLDSWDLGTGAIDDAAGCGIVIAAARQIAKLPRKPKRTVRVVLFANEENGLAGAKAYATEHAAELSMHVAAMEADFGGAPAYEIRSLGLPESPASLLARLVGPLGVARSREEAEGGADVSPLRAAGVPVIDLRQDGTRYFDVHHTANDTLDKVSRAELDRAVAAYALVVWGAADLAGDLGRIPEAKRAARW